jgi:hypothetical protein
MADLFSTDPKRIRERIRRYERALKRELEARYGGDGNRMSIQVKARCLPETAWRPAQTLRSRSGMSFLTTRAKKCPLLI